MYFRLALTWGIFIIFMNTTAHFNVDFIWNMLISKPNVSAVGDALTSRMHLARLLIAVDLTAIKLHASLYRDESANCNPSFER